jgi:pimeloyl-ACP methyl ester carboxylesterase
MARMTLQEPITADGHDAEVHGATPPTPIREGVTVLPGGRALGYAEYGIGDGDVVLWFHGTPGARKQVPPDINEQAVARGYRVIGIDRPGTGLSTPYTYGKVLDWAADVEAFADRLRIDRFATCGLSGGGPFVLAACHALPDRVTAGAVLGGIGPTRGSEAAPGFTRLLPPVEPLINLARLPLGEVLTHLVRPLRAYGSIAFDLYARVAPASDRPIMRQPEMKAMFLHDITTAAEGGMRAPFADLVVFGRDWGFSLRDIDVPVRFWHGDADGIVPLAHGEFQAAMVPGADLVLCPGGGHFAGFILAPDVLDWIDGVWADRPHG